MAEGGDGRSQDAHQLRHEDRGDERDAGAGGQMRHGASILHRPGRRATVEGDSATALL
jgi:hypothetical protein